MPEKLHAVYELKDDTLHSAKRLYNLMHRWHQLSPGNEYNDAPFLGLIAEKLPQLLDDLGFNHRAIQVKNYTGGLNRAYEENPSCYIAPHKPHQIYLYAPIDYRGQHFVPKDATRLSDAEEKRVGLMLWSGGWSNPITLLTGQRQGTALPGDFDPARHQTIEASHLGSDPARPYRFFKAAGETLTALTQKDRLKEQYQNSVQQLYTMVDGLKAAFIKAGAITAVSSEDEFYFNFMLGGDAEGQKKLELSARRTDTGDRLDLRDNAWFTTKDDVITPNPATAEGQSLQAAFNAIPENPYARSYGLDQPVIRHFTDGIYLACPVPQDGTALTPPPGAIEIPQAAFLWMDADHTDLEIGITPPPAPEQLKPAAKGPRHEP